MNKTIQEMDWESLLPEPLKSDKELYAMAKAIGEQKRKIAAEIRKVRIWTEIDSLPEEVLDILAEDLDIRWYSGDYTLETKRNIIKSAFTVYKTLGTAGAVVQALKDVYNHAEVYEWFEYGGDPYYFKVLIDTTPNRESLSHSKILETINTYKPVRDWIDYIAYMQREQIAISVSTAVYRLDYPMCGTEPGISTGLSIERSGIHPGVSGVAFTTDYPMCGEESI